MTESLLLGIATILVAGIGAQWLSWLFKWPSIVLLLGIGFLAGPVTQLVKPDEVLGPLLMPLVSISVAVILFEGGLGLRIYELKKIGREVFGLVSIGVLVTWISITFSAHFILGLNYTISTLLGAILVVTGPTVIIPLLRHVRPSGKTGSIIKWEGIVTDPVGAALAVLVFEYIIVGQSFSPTVVFFFLKSIFVGSVVGALGAWLLLTLLRKYWIPDFLHGTATLMLVVVVSILSSFFHHESGLFAVIAMGMILGNQRNVEVKHIVSFKENLGILIISTLFIILAARLKLTDFNLLNWDFFIFLAVLFFVARPLAVFLSTRRSGLNIKEKLFISWIAPRGIVAAAISSIFAFKLSEQGVPQTEYLVPVTFFVIIATVTVYGLSSSWVARKLGLSRSNPQGVLILGGHKWARVIAKMLQDEGIKIILVDSNARNVTAANKENLIVYEENILNQEIEENIDLDGVGRLIALTANDEANSLAVLHFRDVFGRSEVYQLYPSRKEKNRNLEIPPSLRGRYLFGVDVSYDLLTECFNQKFTAKVITVAEGFKEEDFFMKYGKEAIKLFIIDEKKELKIFTIDEKLQIKKNDKLLILSPATLV